MERSSLRAMVVMLALVMPAASCRTFTKVFAARPPSQSPSYAALDEPPPSHTGGLAVLSSGPPAQTSGGLLNTHGNMAAGALATGVGMAVIGATAVKTVEKCTEGDASATCLAGPSAADAVNDGGAP